MGVFSSDDNAQLGIAIRLKVIGRDTGAECWFTERL